MGFHGLAWCEFDVQRGLGAMRLSIVTPALAVYEVDIGRLICGRVGAEAGGSTVRAAEKAQVTSYMSFRPWAQISRFPRRCTSWVNVRAADTEEKLGNSWVKPMGASPPCVVPMRDRRVSGRTGDRRRKEGLSDRDRRC
jgi:hypothetical protein